MSDILEWAKAMVHCCSCEGSLQSSRYLNMVGLLKQATWKYPVYGNILVYKKYPINRAAAILCDRCIDENRQARFAVEWNQEKTHVTYHRVEELKDLPPIPDEEIAKAEWEEAE